MFFFWSLHSKKSSIKFFFSLFRQYIFWCRPSLHVTKMNKNDYKRMYQLFTNSYCTDDGSNVYIYIEFLFKKNIFTRSFF